MERALSISCILNLGKAASEPRPSGRGSVASDSAANHRLRASEAVIIIAAARMDYLPRKLPQVWRAVPPDYPASAQFTHPEPVVTRLQADETGTVPDLTSAGGRGQYLNAHRLRPR